jgi:hypothetical protein
MMNPCRKRLLAWIGLSATLLIGGYSLLFMFSLAALSVSPGYPRRQAVFLLWSLGATVVVCLVAAIVLAVYLRKSYCDQLPR